MPNTRRRKFSVQNAISIQNTSKSQNESQTSSQTLDLATETQISEHSLPAKKSNKHRKKISLTYLKKFPQSGHKSNANIMKTTKNNNSSLSVSNNLTHLQFKNISTSTTDIYLFVSSFKEEEISYILRESTSNKETCLKIQDNERMNKEITKREKHTRHHRIKVRSPKRRIEIIDSSEKKYKNSKITASTSIVLCKEQESSLCQEYQDSHNAQADNDNEITTEIKRASNHSFEDMCRICHGSDVSSIEVGQLISACTCRGTVGRVHVKCLERWLTESGKSRCELCGTKYSTRRVHRYGVPKALLMWILSQNTKQLMVDTLGIVLMSPLAVLAAWLSGRTLSGLMNQDSHVTPWPLASTFVLACMTLVCYYCWIVSAATRHALAWWIWYRSQYEVRLQLQDNEE